MAEITYLSYVDDDGNESNSLTDFLKELSEKHKNEEEKYIVPLVRLIKNFEDKGPGINKEASKNFPPYRKLEEIHKNLSELRTKECRFFLYKIGNGLWLGLHGYEKQSTDMPRHEKARALGEIKTWEAQKKKSK